MKLTKTQRDYDADMKLPEGKTCGDCCHIRRCKAFGFTWPERTSCDFYPNKFTPAGRAALSEGRGEK